MSTIRKKALILEGGKVRVHDSQEELDTAHIFSFRKITRPKVHIREHHQMISMNSIEIEDDSEIVIDGELCLI